MILYKNLAVVAFSVLMVNRSPLLEKFIVPDKMAEYQEIKSFNLPYMK